MIELNETVLYMVNEIDLLNVINVFIRPLLIGFSFSLLIVLIVFGLIKAFNLLKL